MPYEIQFAEAVKSHLEALTAGQRKAAPRPSVAASSE